MLTLDTVVDAPGLISATRSPWTGSLREAFHLDYDGMSHMLWTIADYWDATVPEDEDDDRSVGEVLADLADAGADDMQVLRDLFDDPNIRILG